ncbi:MAG: Methyltransferase family protein [Parcubacteria group bacterium GW2011_GWA2_47_16]|nr:MAG: Methyltransferase family protein [Parcubacteria group bacterium GW2011_GWA2_47_16]
MKCFLCRQNKATEFLNLGKQPLANKYPSSEALFKEEDFFPLTVFFCANCKNVQLGTVVSRERMFEDYYYLSSVNLGLVKHFERFSEKLKKAKFLVDIGSNDGILLKPLKALGVKAIGVDPSINVGKIANDQGLTTIVSFFNDETAETIKKQYGKPDVVVASSIFTHLENPHQFIEAVKNLMTLDGDFIIEVEYIGNILKDVQFERFYLDRVFYYSLTSLKHLFESHDMYVSDVEKIKPHGGSIRVTAKNKGQGKTISERTKLLLKEEGVKFTPSTLKKFKKKVESYIKAFRKKLEQYRKRKLRVAGYGAPARVATITNFGQIGPSLISFIIDDSPLKQNRWSPGMHIPIFPKTHLEKHRPDILVVFAYEYFDDIKKKTKKGGYKYLIAIPPREVR